MVESRTFEIQDGSDTYKAVSTKHTKLTGNGTLIYNSRRLVIQQYSYCSEHYPSVRRRQPVASAGRCGVG